MVRVLKDGGRYLVPLSFVCRGEIELSRFQVGSHHAPQESSSLFFGGTRCRFVMSKEGITVILDQVQHAAPA